MPKMRAVQVARPKAPFEIVEREIPDPGPGSVRIKVQACGICHSDTLTRDGTFPLVEYPRVPGHEVVGVVDAVGSGVARWSPGQRVGVGWHGGNCGYCDACRRADFFACQTFTAITGILGVQFAARAGFRTVGIARGKDKEPLARQLGARHYIDSQAQDPATELRNLGGAKVILATVTNGDAMAAVVGGLGSNGTLMVIGAAPSLTVSPGQLIGGCLAVKGWYSGTSIDSQDTLAFCVLTGVRSMNEVFPLERVAEAYDRMLSGQARFRVVLTMSS